jgi:1,4-dihydroxy-2-naphthoate octaprenyltransferase
LCAAVGSAYAHFDARRGTGFLAHLLLTLGAFSAAVGVNLVDHAWDGLGESSPDAARSFVAGFGALAIAALCGFGLVPLSGSAALGYGLLAVLLGLSRSAPVVGLGGLGRGLGEIATVVATGPLAVTAGFASQAGTGSWGAFLAGTPPGLIATASLFLLRGSRRDPSARGARPTAAALPLLGAVAVALAVAAGEYGPWACTAAVPLAVVAIATWRHPSTPSPEDDARLGRLSLVCALAALACIVVSLRMAPSG